MSSYLENLPSITGHLGDSIVIFNEYVLQPTKIDGGTRLTISRDNEVQTIDIMDGYTPQKGVDYWSEADKDEMKQVAAHAALSAISVDSTLSEVGKPADSAVVGAQLQNVTQAINSLVENGTGVASDSKQHHHLITDNDGNACWEERTHYAYTTVTDLLPECSMTYADESIGILLQDFSAAPIVGETYAVEWNGIVYQCPALTIEADGISSVYFGSGIMLGEEHNDVPFMILLIPEAFRENMEGASAIVYILDGSTEATVKITGKIEVVKPIDRKFLTNLRCQTPIYLSTNGAHLESGTELTPNVPFAVAWAMDDAELQSSVQIIEEDTSSSNYCAVYGVTRYQSDHWMNTIQMNCTLFNDVNHGFELVIQWYDDGYMGSCSVTNKYELLPDISRDGNNHFLTGSNRSWQDVSLSEFHKAIGIDSATINKANSGKLLYVGADGLVLPLTVGDGLEIVDGILKLTASE